MLKIGETLNNTYLIEEKIGAGAVGTIYKAYHLRLKKYVVIKQIKQELRGKINERIEVDILKNLKHSYIPQVYDFVEHNDEVYTIIEYIAGSSLADELKKRKRFPQKRVIKWAIQLCEALSYLHSRNIPVIHSDIKPDNIMLNTDDSICLIDFNISLLFTDDVSAIGFTEGYSPPEQVSIFNIINRMSKCRRSSSSEKTELLESAKATENIETCDDTGFTALNSGKSLKKSKNIKNKIDEKSDIYSLGSSLYHLVFGEKPDNFNFDMTTKISKQKIKICKDLYQIIKKATNIDPENRYKTADEMACDLKNIKIQKNIFIKFSKKVC
jgi:serine/threonine-protein kinase